LLKSVAFKYNDNGQTQSSASRQISVVNVCYDEQTCIAYMMAKMTAIITIDLKFR